MFILIIYNAFLRIQGLTLRYHLHGDDRAGSTSLPTYRTSLLFCELLSANIERECDYSL